MTSVTELEEIAKQSRKLSVDQEPSWTTPSRKPRIGEYLLEEAGVENFRLLDKNKLIHKCS